LIAHVNDVALGSNPHVAADTFLDHFWLKVSCLEGVGRAELIADTPPDKPRRTT
jgi:hypothetical protein